MSQIQIYEKKPEEFAPQVEVAACYVEVDDKLLLLQLASGKEEAGKWGVPAGKLEKGEAPERAAARELFEETGIVVGALSQMGSLYIRKPQIDYVYHLFRVCLEQIPAVCLSREHQTYKWASSRDLEEMPLMAGAREALSHYRKTPKRRPTVHVSGYLILKQDNKILLQLRKNTGYCDGMWSFVAGHVEDGEPATAGMIREAREEIGIDISPAELEVVHVMHRKSNRLNVDVFFNCNSWRGSIQNRKLDKCERLQFFSLDCLPPNMVDYNRAALEYIAKGTCYSEMGWES